MEKALTISLVKGENTSNGEILKPTKMNFVNNGKGKIINDCDHKCPKAVGFSYRGVCCIVLNVNQRKGRESMI